MQFTRRIRSIRSIACVAALIAPVALAGAQVKVELRDAGPGTAADILGRALAAPHSVIVPQAGRYVIPADSVRAQTVIALGTTVVVEGTVHGDLIVVGGDLYMHPGGTVDGRAVAIGGGVYESMLGHTGSVIAYRDFTYDIAPISGGYSLSYRSLEETSTVPTFSRTGFQGIQIPTYDRSNGLSLPFAALIAVPHSGVRVVPSLTYRSQLGRVDPMVAIAAPLDRRTMVRLEAGRGTFTNDAWIRSDLINSAEYFLVGDDTRNYYRASRAQLTLSRTWESESATLEPFIGAQVERGTSVRPGLNAAGGPWALLNRSDRDDVLRPNPMIDPGTTSSVLAGAAWKWGKDGVDARATLNEEVGNFSSKAGFASQAGTFAQTTIDGKINFSTFGDQSLGFDGHGVFTGGAEPRQRWAYIGGPGSIPTLGLLERGGNQLFYLDARYAIPFERVQVPMVGSPIITLRDILAGAAESRFPNLSQAAGVRVSIGFFYGELLVDPVSHHTYKGFGISIDH
jgi:hypothetical protein